MSYSLLNPSGGNSSNYHLVPNLSFHSGIQPMQGPHLNVGTFSTPSFSMPNPAAPTFDLSNIQAHQPGTGLFSGTVKAFVKSEVPNFEIPSQLKTAGVALSAFHTADKLVNNIDKALDSGQTPTEAYVCQTARTLTEELSGKTMKGFLVGGIPAYLTLATTNPALAATVPFVLPVIPTAYQGADVAAQLGGKGVETVCHFGFEKARQLINEGGSK